MLQNRFFQSKFVNNVQVDRETKMGSIETKTRNNVEKSKLSFQSLDLEMFTIKVGTKLLESPKLVATSFIRKISLRGL